MRDCNAVNVTSVFVRRPAACVRRTADIDRGTAFFDICYFSFLIHYERCAVRYAPLGHQHAVSGCCLAGRKIAEEWEGEGKLLGKFALGGGIIGADSEDLCVSAFKLRDTSLVSRHLFRSATGERGGEEGQHHVLLAAKIRQLDLLALGRLQFEIRRRITHLEVSLGRSLPDQKASEAGARQH